MELAQIMSAIPVQIAVVEQVFRLYKSRLSNRLQTLTVDSLLYIKMLCSSLKQLDVDAAAQRYMVILKKLFFKES
jgi:hypothetical protein